MLLFQMQYNNCIKDAPFFSSKDVNKHHLEASYGDGVIPRSQFQASATLLLTAEIQCSGGLCSYQILQKWIKQLKRWN